MVFTDDPIDNLQCPDIPMLDINPLTKEITILTDVTIFMFYSALKEAFLNDPEHMLLAAYKFPMKSIGGDPIGGNRILVPSFILDDDWNITNPVMILPSHLFSLYEIRERNISELLN